MLADFLIAILHMVLLVAQLIKGLLYPLVAASRNFNAWMLVPRVLALAFQSGMALNLSAFLRRPALVVRHCDGTDQAFYV